MLKLGRRPALTGIRAVAVILVLLHHFDIRFLPQTDEQAGAIFPGGFVGVDVFFVLSGFLITTLLMESHERAGRIDFAEFWQSRLYRLLPALLVTVVLVALGLTVLGRIDWREAAYTTVVTLFYGSNWAAVTGKDVVPALGHTWSLAVEAQFYLIWPLLLAFALKRRIAPRAAIVLLVAGIVAVTVWRAILWAQSGVYYEVFPRTDIRIDSMMMGALVSVFWREGFIRASQMRLLAIPALLVLLAISLTVDLHSSAMFLWGYSASALASAVLVFALLDTDWWLGRALATRPAVYLGSISYSLYLWHFPVLFVVGFILRDSPIVGIAVAAALSFGLAALSWRFVEQPALRLKSRRKNRLLNSSDAVVRA